MNETAAPKSKYLKCSVDLKQRRQQLKRDCEKLERERDVLTDQMIKMQSSMARVHIPHQPHVIVRSGSRNYLLGSFRLKCDCCDCRPVV